MKFPSEAFTLSPKALWLQISHKTFKILFRIDVKMKKKKLSYYSWLGYGLLVATIFGIDKFGFWDYRVIALFILTVCLLAVDVIRFYREK